MLHTNGENRSTPREPRVLIVHDFCEMFGGAERIAAEIAASFPNSEFVAITGREEVAERMGVADRFSTLLPTNERLLRNYRKLAPFYPFLAASKALPEADLLISSSYAFAHGFRTSNDAPHLSYCCSPLRFAWTMGDEYGEKVAGVRVGKLLDPLAAPFRMLDRRASRRVDRYIAESDYVAEQIGDFFGRHADVLHPPIDCDLFTPAEVPSGGYTLMCGRLIEPYKQPTIVVEAFRRMPDRRLVIAGDGPELESLRAIAPPNVEFVGQLKDAALTDKMRNCEFAIFPSKDDFGLVPVEVMACGRPVLAFSAGGALETMAPGVTGEFFDAQNVETVVRAVEAFDASAYSPTEIREHARTWEVEGWRQRLRAAAFDLLDSAGEVAASGAEPQRVNGQAAGSRPAPSTTAASV